ncbi:chemotaxis-specific protein-glutamate methyltransferase CheB [Uliginosibacterium sp. 31-16]|uniref:chemotaxis-specific protein-glutamate methyltransferase CheB n=1 Tax=Uliginosibacterium sp. 31-16 TaxID=3068315 RepID=UPI00273EB03E|nr:chemotaxis-specific protein-glutamate methyltransferase CheB [Uliginosibacterium sp. 31-16]MDP5240940.1 chemotaxis-specific protein-glutamate methyltransferase CheB [Uliginosibacterium sp. 31-16]
MTAIKLLIVDDSPLAARHLASLFARDAAFVLLGIARNGVEGVAMAASLKPDVVCMDITMPDIDGFEATRRIMAASPVPIVIVSSTYEPRLVSMAFRALETGALAILEKPPAGNTPDSRQRQDDLLATFRAMAARRAVRGISRALTPAPAGPAVSAAKSSGRRPELLLIGASTGGPQVIQTVLKGLPASFPLPILIVQHMSPGFSAGFAQWLSQTTPFDVRLAVEGESPRPGCAYVAPEKLHMEWRTDRCLHLLQGDLEHGVKPAVSRLFRSALAADASVVAVLLSGMGKDGAAELKALRDAGMLTIAQDQASSVVHGMPGTAIRLGGASMVLADTAIAPALLRALGLPG